MEQLPYFYINSIDASLAEYKLDEDTSKHIIQVLRLKKGDRIQLTDGLGNLLTASIVDDYKKKCIVKKEQIRFQGKNSKPISIAISLLKNASRFEWFLEKAMEIGIAEIIPMICDRTEKQHFRHERMKNILISALIQSRQTWLPILHEPLAFGKLIRQSAQEKKFIAHCIPGNKSNLATLMKQDISSQIILIGPEGDFTSEEIELAIQYHFTPVALGETRLRSETAAMVAAAIMKICT